MSQINPTKRNWARLIGMLSMALFATTLASCDKDDIDFGKDRPEWGPTITNNMLDVINKLDTLSKGVPLQSLSPQEARMAPSAADAAMAVMQDRGIPMPPSTVDTTGREVPVAGGTIHVRVYTPQNATAGPHPGIVYYHGGGWVIANLDTYDASARALAEKAGAVVVSVAYRQAPEYKFPTAHNDSYAAYEWVLENAASINVDPARVAVAGESAGGNLAAAVSMMARDNGIQLPVHQLLVYPIADYDFNTESYNKYANAKPLNRPLMQWFFGHYLRNAADGNSPWISLVDAPNLAGLPSATVILAEIDPLQTEGKLYAERLKNAGVDVTSRVYEGVTHEFFGMAAILPEAEQAQKLAADELKAAFAR